MGRKLPSVYGNINLSCVAKDGNKIIDVVLWDVLVGAESVGVFLIIQFHHNLMYLVQDNTAGEMLLY